MRYDPITKKKSKSKPKIIKIYKMYKNKNVSVHKMKNTRKKNLNYTSTDKRKLIHGEDSQ